MDTKNNVRQTPSRSSPRSSKRGCLCKNTLKYSVKCCDGSIWAQGIGPITYFDRGLQLFEAYSFRVIQNGGIVEGDQCCIDALNNLNNITTFDLNVI